MEDFISPEPSFEELHARAWNKGTVNNLFELMDLPRDPVESRASESVKVWQQCLFLCIPAGARSTVGLRGSEKIMVRKDYITTLEDAIACSELRYDVGQTPDTDNDDIAEDLQSGDDVDEGVHDGGDVAGDAFNDAPVLKRHNPFLGMAWDPQPGAFILTGQPGIGMNFRFATD